MKKIILLLVIGICFSACSTYTTDGVYGLEEDDRLQFTVVQDGEFIRVKVSRRPQWIAYTPSGRNTYREKRTRSKIEFLDDNTLRYTRIAENQVQLFKRMETKGQVKRISKVMGRDNVLNFLGEPLKKEMVKGTETWTYEEDKQVIFRGEKVIYTSEDSGFKRFLNGAQYIQ